MLPALLVLVSLTASPSSEPTKISAERLDSDPEALRWDGPQFVQADKKGRVFLLNGETLAVHPLDRKGRPGEPTKLEAAAPAGFEPAPVAWATMSRAGGDWLLGSRQDAPRYFPGGKERALPALPQWPSGLGFAGSSPVVAVLPLGLGETATPPRLPGENPLLLELSGTKWTVRTRFDYQPPEAGAFERKSLSRWVNLLGARRLAERSDGRLWVAHVHAYRLELQSPTGKVLASAQVGPSHGRFRDHTDEERERLLDSAPQLAGKGLGVLPVYVVVGLGADREGRAYLVIQEAGRFFLDRFTPDDSKLERLELTGLEGSNFTLAAGLDGLYLTPYNGLAGRYRIAWETLEVAEWSEVPGAQLTGGLPAVPTKP
jgi:hypothetical protein